MLMDLFTFFQGSDWRIYSLFVFIVTAFIQVYLSRKESKWPGLVIPFIWFGILGIFVFLPIIAGGLFVLAIPVIGFVLMIAAVIAFLYQIPLIIYPVLLLVIYCLCRGYNLKQLKEYVYKLFNTKTDL